MPFFQQAYLPTEAALFQLLSELDQPQQKQQQHPCVRRVHRPQSFTPRFDVTETNEAYELYGEVPGLEQADLDIQFQDAQTLVIKGKTERRLNVNTNAAASAPAAEVEQTAQADAETSSQKSGYSATVEDDYDEADTPLVTPATTSATPTAAEKGKQPESAGPSAAAPETQSPRARYWVAERKVGEFARSFTFEQRIEQDFVTAGLKNGVLNVVVPKSLKSKRVAVSVL
ncbi:putative 30 kDa heat shock protein [Cadophora sp. MPI-SDFR-AT-0126]|nr:putative 30 kDa heat shock protein [Leotiomycetes sp. MPI-SDFR-AT-0126]